MFMGYPCNVIEAHPDDFCDNRARNLDPYCEGCAKRGEYISGIGLTKKWKKVVNSKRGVNKP